MKSWTDFKVILPNSQMNSSEFTSPYWAGKKPRIIGNHFDKFRIALFRNQAYRARSSQRGPAQVQLDRMTHSKPATDSGSQALPISDPKADVSGRAMQPQLAPTIDCGVARLLQRDIGSNPPGNWRSVITTESMTTRLWKLKIIVTKPRELQKFPDIADYVQSFTHGIATNDHTLLVQSLLDKEARVSSFLLFLSRHQAQPVERIIFYGLAGG